MACWDSRGLFINEAGSGCKSGQNMTSAFRGTHTHTLSLSHTHTLLYTLFLSLTHTHTHTHGLHYAGFYSFYTQIVINTT